MVHDMTAAGPGPGGDVCGARSGSGSGSGSGSASVNSLAAARASDDGAISPGPRCDACPAPAAYARRYSGQALCVPCFRRSISRKAAKTISKYDMIRSGDKTVAVAVSGGKDSLALLQIMHGMSQRHNFEVAAITIDEGIPGYRDEALGIVSDVCRGMGLGHRVYSYKDLFEVTLDEALGIRDRRRRQQQQQPRHNAARPQKTSSCSMCGTLRRRAVDIAARDVGADVVATGHNLDDMLQTFLINMLSGDTDKIAWMSPAGSSSSSSSAGAHNGGPRRIKPFCEIYEAEIAYYAFASGLPFQEEPCPHMNEGMRTSIREFLNSLESERAGIKNSMYASAMRMVGMAHDAAALGAAAAADAAAGTVPRMAHAGGGGRVRGGSAPDPDTPSRKERAPCVRCGADCTGPDNVCSVCVVMAGIGRGG